MKKLCNPSPFSYKSFCFQHLPRKSNILDDFFIVSNIIKDFGRLFSLLTEATQMTQNKKKKQVLVLGAASSSNEPPPCVSGASQQRFSGQPGKSHVYFCKNEIVFRKY
jgi:hypothetical protein